MTLIRMKPTGEIDRVPCISEDIRTQLDQLYELIGCRTIEIVRLPGDAALIVDEEGAINGSMMNRIASLLYGHPIFGTALLCSIIHTNDGDIIGDHPWSIETDLLTIDWRYLDHV